MVVICCYLEREKDKILKFYVNNSSYFENKRLPLLSAPTNQCLTFEAQN